MKQADGVGRSGRSRACAAAMALALIAGCETTQRSGQPVSADSRVGAAQPLVTGKQIQERFAIASQNVGSLPVNMVLSADGKFVLTTDEGSRQSVWAIRTSDGGGAGHVEFPKGKTNNNGLYYGLAAAADGTVYAAQGNADAIAVLKLLDDGSLSQKRAIVTRKGDFPAGLALDGRGMLYVANNDPVGSPTYDQPASMVIYNAAEGKEVGRFAFDDTIAGTSNFPLSIAALKDGSKTYVASQRDSAVYVLNTADAAKPALAGKIATGSHPDAMVLNKKQSKLFVANAQSDTISVVRTKDDKIVATGLLRPEIAADLPGATPTGLALSPDEKRLYVTLADMNAVAVVDVAGEEECELLGYLPAGWYPTAMAVAPDNKRLLVANAKGVTLRNPNPPAGAKKGHVSPLTLLEGTVATIELPASKPALAEQTKMVLEDNHLTPRYIRVENPLKEIGLQAGKISHVIYVVKENRTYDQVLGDLPQGNGEKELCIFGREVTPNLHALAERFVLLDNFYDCGEVSGDGWTWTTQAHSNEYTQRNVPYSYSSRGRKFDYEGEVNGYPAGGFPAKGLDGKPLSDAPQFKDGGKAIPDVAEAPGGHIWDLARKHGLSLRNYGFFVGTGTKKGGVTVIPDNYPAAAGLQPGGHDLAGITDVDYRKFDLNYADSEAGLNYFKATKNKDFLYSRQTYGQAEMPSRFSEWNREFQMMLKKDPTGGAVPNLMLVRLGDDHTQGANPGTHSPRSMVADNDHAVGQIVEAISHSPIWKNTAIFVIEDDAQNGPDHVDAHRSTLYVISPWIKKTSVDHSFQNTVSCIKTMELLLGLPPMCQYDAVSGAILDWDTTPSNAEPYTALAADEKLISQINGAGNQAKPVSPELKTMIDQSKAMDFTVADRAPADELNRIIWQTVKGPGAKMPESPQGPQLAGVKAKPKDDDDD